jgi:hypothetical protein
MTQKEYVTGVRIWCAMPLLLACGSKDPCPGVVDGATYDIEIGSERETSVPAAGCQDAWGFTPGLVLSATTTELQGDGECLVGIPVLDGVTGWTFTESNTEVTSGGFMLGMYRATSGKCTGLLSFELAESVAAFPCFQNGGGNTDACLMKLTFEPRSGGCSASCNAFLATTVTRR